VAEQSNWTPDRIRNAELPRTFRGFDEEATRGLLYKLAQEAETASTRIGELESERQRLAEQVSAYETVVGELEAALAEQSTHLEETGAREERIRELEQALSERERTAFPGASGEEAARLIQTATHTVDSLLEETRAEAARMTSQATAEAQRLLDEAREASQRTHEEVASLRRFVQETRSGLAASLQTALGELGGSGREHDADEAHDLVGDLLPPTSADQPSEHAYHAGPESHEHPDSSESHGWEHQAHDGFSS
jgi:cell division septum initiation protein DivIVA